MKNRFLKTILYIILVASFIGVFFVMSIMDLTNTKDVHEISIDAAAQLLIVENSINGIIPTGKDYYYIGINEETGCIYTIHAGKKWLTDHFDSNGMANGNSVSVKGLAKRAGDYDVEKELAQRAGQVAYNAAESGYKLALEPGRVLELNYVQDGVVKLTAGVLILAVGIILFVFRKRTEEFPAWARKAILVLVVVTLIFALWAIL
ncbi:MAG: hypothetical protein IJ716_00110 [Lachnospiraceae bacterium]|nr:hypothetical protein [Lachnospiraceae bacterium]